MKIITKCQAINNLDLTPMIERISDPNDELTYSSGWPRETAEAISEQYKAFLYLVKTYPDETIIPFREVDELWHQHILHTQEYTRDCMAVFGRYFHHQPHKQKTDDDADFYTKHYARTLELLEKEFPDLD